MEAESLVEHDAGQVLDRLQQRAGVTEIQLNCFQYYLWNRRHTPVWVRTDPARYRSLGVGHADRAAYQHGDIDILDRALAAARPRGIQVHARYLEGFQEYMAEIVPGFARCLGESSDGSPSGRPCWWNPAYRAWWHATVSELVETHPVDGVYLGPERDGPLGPVLHNAAKPFCFCAHCQAAGRSLGVDPQRARAGWNAVHALATAAQRGALPTDGMLVSLLRLLVEWPEVLGWEKVQREGKWTLHAELAGATRQAGRQFGFHICMYSMVWDLFARATTDYARLATFCDYIKPSTYFDVNAARLHGFIRQGGGQVVWRDLAPQTVFQLLNGAIGAPIAATSDWNDLANVRCSPDWTAREVARCVTACAGTRCVTMSGIGIDVPPPDKRDWPVAQADIAAAAQASLAAGAAGLLLSREYQYMRDASLDTIGQVVRARTLASATTAR
jgi:hypothetical protein